MQVQPLDSISTLIYVTGRLDMHSAPELRQTLRELREQGKSMFYIDLSEVGFISSFGLAVLVSGLRAARHHHGDMLLINPSDAVMMVLECTRLEQHMPIFDTLEAARLQDTLVLEG